MNRPVTNRAAMSSEATTRSIAVPLLWTASALAWLGLPASADMVDTSAMAPWEVCALCHGAEGVTTMARFPHLAGQKPEYLRRQLVAFRSGARHNDGGQMAPTAAAVPDAALDAIVSHFSALAPPPGNRTDAIARQAQAPGEQLFRHGRDGIAACADCHAVAASPAPWLFGQHAGYLQKQLLDFASGARRDGAAGHMAVLAAQLTSDEIGAVATYLEAASRCFKKSEKYSEKKRNSAPETTCYDKL